MTQKTPSIFKKSSDLAILTIISRILGLVRESVTAAFLGTGALADAFAVAFTIPNVVRRLFADGVISSAFIPRFKGLLAENKRGEAAEFLSALFTIVSLVSFVFVAVAFVFSGGITAILAPTLEENAAAEAALLAKIMFPYVFFISLAALTQSVLNSSGIFRPSGASPIVFNIAFITAAFLIAPLTGNPARALAVGVFTGGFLQLALQLPFMTKTLFCFTFTSLNKAFANPNIARSGKMVLAALFGTGAYQLNVLLTTNMANRAGEGVVSSLRFSARIEELVIGVFVVTLSTVILPELVENAKSRNFEKLTENLDSALKFVAFVSIPALVFTLVNSTEIVQLLFGFGKFDEKSVGLTAFALDFRIAGLFFLALSRILNSFFYALERTALPVFAGICSIVVNFIAAYFLVDTLAGGGIALASSLASLTAALILFIAVLRSFKNSAKFGKTGLYFAKISMISAISVLPLFFFKNHLYAFFDTVFKTGKISEICSFSATALVFMILFVGISAVLKDETLLIIKGIFRKQR
ncbi:murein biosynthesis integral membrane protein MurJ [bacterium]|nr:murein biosynthesis integral membrane protein MurJ [bacterium]